MGYPLKPGCCEALTISDCIDDVIMGPVGWTKDPAGQSRGAKAEPRLCQFLTHNLRGLAESRKSSVRAPTAHESTPRQVRCSAQGPREWFSKQL